MPINGSNISWSNGYKSSDIDHAAMVVLNHSYIGFWLVQLLKRLGNTVKILIFFFVKFHNTSPILILIVKIKLDLLEQQDHP